jgi:hypothetical protein
MSGDEMMRPALPSCCQSCATVPLCIPGFFPPFSLSPPPRHPATRMPRRLCTASRACPRTPPWPSPSSPPATDAACADPPPPLPVPVLPTSRTHATRTTGIAPLLSLLCYIIFCYSPLMSMPPLQHRLRHGCGGRRRRQRRLFPRHPSLRLDPFHPPPRRRPRPQPRPRRCPCWRGPGAVHPCRLVRLPGSVGGDGGAAVRVGPQAGLAVVVGGGRSRQVHGCFPLCVC